MRASRCVVLRTSASDVADRMREEPRGLRAECGQGLAYGPEDQQQKDGAKSYPDTSGSWNTARIA